MQDWSHYGVGAAVGAVGLWLVLLAKAALARLTEGLGERLADWLRDLAHRLACGTGIARWYAGRRWRQQAELRDLYGRVLVALADQRYHLGIDRDWPALRPRFERAVKRYLRRSLSLPAALAYCRYRYAHDEAERHERVAEFYAALPHVERPPKLPWE